MKFGAGNAGLALAVLSAIAFSFKAIFVKLGLAPGADAGTLLALRMGFALRCSWPWPGTAAPPA